MSTSITGLLVKKRFLPYFITQYFGAFNDNLFKNVLILMVAFSAVETLPISSDLFINLSAGLFILPYFLFSASAGVLADTTEKSRFIRMVKLLEIAIMCIGALCFITESYLMLLLVLFLMGVQSAFFGPVKYSLLPQHLKTNELLQGNALVETGTFVAILLGTLGAGLVVASENAKYFAAISITLFSVLGYIASKSIPDAPALTNAQQFSWRPIRHTRETMAKVRENKTLSHLILGVSWFGFLGQHTLPNYLILQKSTSMEMKVPFLYC